MMDTTKASEVAVEEDRLYRLVALQRVGGEWRSPQLLEDCPCGTENYHTLDVSVLCDVCLRNQVAATHQPSCVYCQGTMRIPARHDRLERVLESCFETHWEVWGIWQSDDGLFCVNLQNLSEDGDDAEVMGVGATQLLAALRAFLQVAGVEL